ncbi:beta strand repeat-containing protein [Micavibrio aeruginosavorus]|uniref:beta strand repeat-containing protein n=1 Tax=Micavibrio aeruginosavorus TaxID=349221 RepID=UPI003F4AC785
MVAYSAGAVWRRALFRPLTYGAVLFLSGILSLFSTAAFAACSSPSGVAGDLIWDNTANAPSYCNDTDWVHFPSGSSGDTYVATMLFNNPSAVADDDFGASLGISDGKVAVGVRMRDPGGVSNAGRAFVFDVESGARLSTLANPDPTAGDQFGHGADIDGNLVAVGAPVNTVGGSNQAGSVYVLNASTGALISTLDNPAPDVMDWTGYDVAISGTTVVAGTPRNGAGDHGSVHVFNGATGAFLRGWNAPDQTDGDWFGTAVDIDGDLIVVGSPQKDPGGVADAGGAYVFRASTGALVATLNNPSPGANDNFGRAVAIFGTTVVVGAYGDTSGGVANAGAAYVFDATTGALRATLENPNPAANDNFGMAVAVSGSKAVVGARWDDVDGFTDVGATYVFNVTTGVLIDTIKNPSPASNATFGSQVEIEGDTIVVSARAGMSSGVANAGVVYVFNTGRALFQNPDVSTQIDNPFPEANDRFATSVSASGALILVGAYQANPGGLDNAGAAYVFNRMTGSLVSTLNNPTPAVSDVFGWEVALDDNIAVVGANQDDPGGVVDAGSAYVFDATTGSLLFTLNNPAPQTTDVFGINVRIDGNLIAVGATLDNPGGVNDAGSVYIFNATTGALMTTIPNPAPAVGDRFAGGLDISGNLVAVGAYWDDPGGIADSGTAYVFNATTGALVSTLNNPVPASGDEFGYEVKIDGDLVVVGAWHNDPDGVSDAGVAYVFNATTGAFVSTLVNPTPAISDHFGARLSIDGTTVFVSAHVKDVGGVADAGVVYVFDALTGALIDTIENPDPAASDSFGRAVSADSGSVVIGALNNQVGAVLGAGSVYVYAPTCATPAGVVGDITYNTTSHVLQYCTGGDWVGAGPAGDGGAGCASPAGVEGDLMYNSDHNYLQYCEGDTWRGIGF